ncbi:hypothetical protein ACFCV8_10950, partial [Streptomyces sp. NPDC056347]
MAGPRAAASVPAPARSDAARGPLLRATALVRASGIPCSVWTAAGGSGPFGRVVEHADTVERQAARARRSAAEPGALVPGPRLTGPERRTVLALLHDVPGPPAPG